MPKMRVPGIFPGKILELHYANQCISDVLEMIIFLYTDTTFGVTSQLVGVGFRHLPPPILPGSATVHFICSNNHHVHIAQKTSNILTMTRLSYLNFTAVRLTLNINLARYVQF